MLPTAVVRVYVLHIEGVPRLRAAFARVMESERVESCMIEPEACRLRFVAPPVRGDVLVEEIYLEGGLLWCSRHGLVSASERDASSASSLPA